MKKMLSTIKQKMKPRIAPLPEGCDFKHPAMFLATWFGSGLIRPAPGTMGSIAAIPVGMLIYFLFGFVGFLIAIVLVFIIGVYVSNIFERQSATHDNSSIVIDEVVGLWIAAIPAALSLWVWIFAFILFRLFDIWKPWPISWLDREIEGGLGVMLDDVLAGVFALFGTAMITLPFMGMLYAQ